jgi:hypothetical protein
MRWLVLLCPVLPSWLAAQSNRTNLSWTGSFETLSQELGVVEHTCNPNTLEAEAGGWWIWGQTGLPSKFKVSLSYIPRLHPSPCPLPPKKEWKGRNHKPNKSVCVSWLSQAFVMVLWRDDWHSVTASSQIQ